MEQLIEFNEMPMRDVKGSYSLYTISVLIDGCRVPVEDKIFTSRLEAKNYGLKLLDRRTK